MFGDQQILASKHERKRLAGRDVTRVEHEEIDLFVLAAGWRDVFALLPDEESVQLEIFAHDRFTDGSHAGVPNASLQWRRTSWKQCERSVFPSPGLRPPSPHPMGRGQGEGRCCMGVSVT